MRAFKYKCKYKCKDKYESLQIQRRWKNVLFNQDSMFAMSTKKKKILRYDNNNGTWQIAGGSSKPLSTSCLPPSPSTLELSGSTWVCNRNGGLDFWKMIMLTKDFCQRSSSHSVPHIFNIYSDKMDSTFTSTFGQSCFLPLLR